MTSFFALIPCIRTVLADAIEPYSYADEVIINAIQIAITGMDGYDTVGNIFVNPTMTDAGKLLAIFSAAKILKQPSRGFSYRTPVLSVTRDMRQDEGLLAWYDEEIAKWEAGGHIPILGEGAIEAYLTMSDRLEEILDEFTP